MTSGTLSPFARNQRRLAGCAGLLPVETGRIDLKPVAAEPFDHQSGLFGRPQPPEASAFFAWSGRKTYPTK